MTTARIPVDEAQRLQVLHSLALLDTAPDPTLDGLVRCVAHLMACPTALVSLVDQSRQWFKARVGLDRAETPREWSFCAHAILEEGLFEVPDASVDPRFADNPLVTGEPRLRFYAGVPISHDGQRLGTLCVIDLVPRSLAPAQRLLLEDLARLASAWLGARSDHLALQATTEAALRRSQLLEAVAQEVPGVVFQLTASASGQAALPYVSTQVVEMLELEPCDLENNPQVVMERVHPDDRGPLAATLAHSHYRLAVWEQEFRVVLPLRGLRWKAAHATPSRRADGTVVWHGFLSDVTARRERESRAAELQQRWQLAVAAAQLGLVDVDVATGEVDLDATACDQFGLPDQHTRLDVDAWLALFALDDAGREVLRAQLLGIRAGQTLSMSCDVLATDETGTRRHLELIAQATALPGDTTPRVVGTCRDVTASHQVEQLRRDKIAAEMATIEKSRFLSRMSHELRTPLNAILGFTQLLQLDEKEPLSPRQKVHARHAHDAGRLLLKLINEILDLGQVEHGARHLDMVGLDLRLLLEATLPLVAQLAERAGVWIDVIVPEALPKVHGDSLALEQVLLNLLSNGIKYNRRGGRLAVQLRRVDGMVHVAVGDEGPGLCEDQLTHLFEPFNRLGAEGTPVEGSGLGLVISRELVQAMQGQLQVSSTLGQGTTFTVILPVHVGSDPEPAAAQAPRPATIRPRREVTLLYIEDEPVNALLVQEALKSSPQWHLVLASDGPSGLALARALRPALVISDVHLPGLSGLDVVRALRADPGGRQLLCVALSADAMEEQIELALAAGFDDYWTKPLDLAAMPARIERLLAEAKDPLGRSSTP